MSAPVFLWSPTGQDRAERGEPASADPPEAAPGDETTARVVPGDVVILGGPEGRHAAVVQRRGVGERVDLVDGEGLRLECIVVAVDGQALRLKVQAAIQEPEPAVHLVLVQALAKGGRDELAIEAATEVGADAVIPWQANRSITQWRGDRGAKAHAKWESTILAASKQARRAHVPRLGPAVGSRDLIETISCVVHDGGAALVLHEEAATALLNAELPAEAARPTSTGARGTLDAPVDTGPAVAPAPRRGAITPAPRRDGGAHATVPQILVIVGPEGGVTQEELAAFADAGAQAVRLGPHVLRTSTAGPVALALLCQRLGRWS